MRDNIASCAAIKAVIGHSKRLRELQYCGPAVSLSFVNDTTRLHIISPQKYALVGSYLFYAQAHGREIRSGKAYGRDQNFGTRIKAHQTGSLKEIRSSTGCMLTRLYSQTQ